MNLALKTSLRENARYPIDIDRLLCRFHENFERIEGTHEIVLCTHQNSWIVARKSEEREVYVIFETKEVKSLTHAMQQFSKLCNQIFSNKIFV